MVVPDNLRAAVTKGSKYEAVLNESFACFAEHYSMTVLPARAYKPRDKSLVEGAVKLVYKTIFTKLDKRVFYELSSLKAAIRVALEIHNNTPMYKREYSRRQQFEEIERDVLQDLNPIRYKASLEQLDYSVERGLDKNEVHPLASLDFIKEHKDLFITGSTGTGKSYLATVDIPIKLVP